MTISIGQTTQASDTSYDKIGPSFFTNIGFSHNIIRHANPLLNILKASKISIQVGNSTELMEIISSSWGVHLNVNTDLSKDSRHWLEENITKLGLHNIAREHIKFIKHPADRSLLIYLGANPTALCLSLNDVNELSDSHTHTLISASDQEYLRKDFDTCSHFNYQQIALVSKASEQVRISEIMKLYLTGAGFNPKTLAIIPNQSADLNNSARLRRFLQTNPNFLRPYQKIIIVSTQPFGEEAWLSVYKNIDPQQTKVYRLYSLPEVNLKDDLIALRSLLEADLELQH